MDCLLNSFLKKNGLTYPSGKELRESVWIEVAKLFALFGQTPCLSLVNDRQVAIAQGFLLVPKNEISPVSLLLN